MKESIYKSYDELPLFLNADTVAKTLGVSPSSGYEFMHEKDLPALKIGSRKLIETEPTSVITRDGLKGNGKLKYRLRPIQIAVDRHNANKLARLELETARYNFQKDQARQNTLAGNLPPS